jgi:hypothetical protein
MWSSRTRIAATCDFIHRPAPRFTLRAVLLQAYASHGFCRTGRAGSGGGCETSTWERRSSSERQSVVAGWLPRSGRL